MDTGHRYQVEASQGPTPLHKGNGGPLDESFETMAKYSIAPSAVLLRWCIQQSAIAITTLRKAERLEENMQTLEFQLEAANMEEISQSHRYRTAHLKEFDENDRT